jgi:hypothetical protein
MGNTEVNAKVITQAAPLNRELFLLAQKTPSPIGRGIRWIRSLSHLRLIS